MGGAAEAQPIPTGDGADVHAEVAYDLHCMGSNIEVKIPEMLRVLITFAAELNVTLSGEEESDIRTVLNNVSKDLSDRISFGEKKYGTRLKTNNGRDCLMDAYQECLDFIHYIKQAQLEGKIK